jgi:hypothetical protein
MIKSHLQAVLVQSVFRHVLVSSSIEIAIEFSFVGIQGRRERAIGSNRTVGGSIRERDSAVPPSRKSIVHFAQQLSGVERITLIGVASPKASRALPGL